jgi:tetratricopeptide (TPR) repeat protein
MLGTIDGIRGLNVERSKELLESGIKLALKCQDSHGVWLGWNNLGEIFFKLEDFKSAAFFLNKAYEQAKKLDLSSMQLETMRNLLALRLREETITSKETTLLLLKIEEMLSVACEPFVGMQIYNTLATYYLFQNEAQRATSYLKKAIPLTVISKEYHIYTLMNLALLFKIKGKQSKAQTFYEKATQFAKQGSNILALKEIQRSWNAEL